MADQVAINYRKAEITPRQRAMLDFAMKVALDSSSVQKADFATLRSQGFGEDEIWDIGAIAAFFAISNRLTNLAGLPPNDEFYLIRIALRFQRRQGRLRSRARTVRARGAGAQLRHSAALRSSSPVEQMPLPARGDGRKFSRIGMMGRLPTD